MLHAEQIDELIGLVAGLDRNAILRQFREFPCNFPVDFTPDFLDRQPLERLQHLFVAVCIQSKKMPHIPGSQPADEPASASVAESASRA